MRRFAALIMLFLAATAHAGDKLPQPMVTGLKMPESVTVGSDGRIYVTEIGEFGKDGDGAIMVVKDGELKDFDTPLRLEGSSDFYREALALSGMR